MKDTRKPTGAEVSRPEHAPPHDDLAELLSAVMRHPDTPPSLVNEISDWVTSCGEPQADEVERIRRALAEHGADKTQSAAAQPPTSFARALLDFWNNRDDAPEWFNDALVDAVAEMAAHFALPNPFEEAETKNQIEPLERLLAQAGPTFSLRDLPYTLARLPVYPLEIEANRTHYRQEAELLIQLMDLESDHVRPLLDVQPEGILNDEPPPHILWDAIQHHIDALFQGILHNYGVDFLRAFYADLRLYYDKQMLRNHKSSEA